MDNLGWEVLGFIGKAIDGIDKAISKANTKEEPIKAESIVLTCEDLHHLKWMNPDQLRVIFGGGKKKNAVIDNNPKAYNQLKWFSPEQLEAIFGKDGE